MIIIMKMKVVMILNENHHETIFCKSADYDAGADYDPSADYDARAENDQDASAAENDYDPSADYDASEEIPV